MGILVRYSGRCGASVQAQVLINSIRPQTVQCAERPERPAEQHSMNEEVPHQPSPLSPVNDETLETSSPSSFPRKKDDGNDEYGNIDDAIGSEEEAAGGVIDQQQLEEQPQPQEDTPQEASSRDADASHDCHRRRMPIRMHQRRQNLPSSPTGD